MSIARLGTIAPITTFFQKEKTSVKTMMILPIGNNLKLFKRDKKKQHGFSFIEVLMSIAVLYFGIVFIFKAFFISLDSLRYLNHRFYASIQLESRLAMMQRRLDITKSFPLGERRDTRIVILGGETIAFEHLLKAERVNNKKNLYEANLSVSWKDGNRDRKISRSSFLLAYGDAK